MDKFELTLVNCPPSQRQRFSDAADRALSNLKKHIPLCCSLNDPVAQVFYRKELEIYLANKYPLSDDDRVFFIKQVLQLIHNSFDAQLQAQWMDAAKSLLAKKPLDIVIPWRPLYDLLVKYHFSRDNNVTGTANGECDPLVGAVLSSHRKALITLICKAKRYFPENATKQILATLLPCLAPFDNVYFRTQHLLSIILPVNYPEQCKEWLPQMMNEMERIDRCTPTALGWLVLFSRTAKHSIGVIDWSPYLPRIFAFFIQSLKLTAGGTNSPNVKTRNLASKYAFILKPYGQTLAAVTKYMAKLIVYTLGSNTPSMDLTIKMMQSISTFYYPSNNGSWASYLGSLLSHLASFFAKRYGKQLRNEIPQPEGFSLDHNNKDLLNCLLPITLQAVFHKSEQMVSAGTRALAQLAYIYPEHVLEKSLEISYPALADPTKSHRTLGCMKALGHLAPVLFHRKRYSRGAAHLEQLLWAVLPGIDANDVRKTFDAFNFYSEIWCLMPLIDALESNESKEPFSPDDSLPFGEEDPTEEDARRATMSFKDWSLAFVDSTCQLLSHQEAYEKKNYMDLLKLQMVRRTLYHFWSSLSPSIYVVCAKRFADFILSNQVSSAKKYFGHAVACAAFARPDVWLEVITVPLFKKILDEKDGVKCLSHANSSLEWNLYLLSQSVKKSGSSLLPYLAELRHIAILCCASDDKRVKKNGLKLIRNTLNALSTTYVAEGRPFSEVAWSKTWKHWQDWGTFVESRRKEEKSSPKQDCDLQIRWYEPSEEEYAAAQQFAEAILAEPLLLLDKVVSSDVDSLQTDDVVNALVTVRAVVRGCHSIIGGFEGRDVNEQRDLQLLENGGVCPIVVLRALDPLFIIRYGDANVSLRTFLARLLHNLFGKYSGSSLNKMDIDSSSAEDSKNPNIKLLTKLTKLSNFILSEYEVYSKGLVALTRTSQYILKLNANDHISGEYCSIRPFLVERAYSICLRRTKTDPIYTQDAVDLLTDVSQITVHEYPDIAKKGLAVMQLALGRFRRHRRIAIAFALSVLRERGAKEKRVIGAMNFLMSPICLYKILRDWRLLSETIITLCDCEHHDDHEVQVLTNGLFTALYSSMHSLRLRIPLSESPSRNDRIQFVNARNVHTYENLNGSLVNVLHQGTVESKDTSVHWRYQLMAAAFLFKLLRKDYVPAKEVVLQFAQGLLDELLPIRDVCIRAVNCITGTFPGRSGEQDLGSHSSIAFWNGLEVSPQDIYKHDFGDSLSDECINSFQKFFIENNDKIIDALVSDHPALAHATVGKKQKTQGAGQQITRLVKVNSQWPYTRYAKHSKAFMVHHASLIRNLVRLCPSSLEHLSKAIVSLTAKGRDRDAQCTAAEIFCGVIAASAEGSQDLMPELVEKIGSDSLDAMYSCPSESVVDWEDGIRYLSTNQNRDHIKWLVDRIFESCVDDTIDSPSAQAKRLTFLAPLLTEFAWRAKDISLELLKKISLENSGYMKSPYKQVRTEIGKALFYVLRSLQEYSPEKRCSSLESYPVLQMFLTECLDRVEQSQLDPKESEKKEDEDTDGKNLCETMIIWIMACIVNGDLPMYSDVVIKCIPHVIRAKNHSDEHLSAFAKTALQMISWVQFYQSDLQEIFSVISETSKSDSWHVREAAISFLCVFIPRHSLIMTKDQMKNVTNLVTGLLADAQLEVRLLASSALVSIFLSTDPQKYRPRLIKKFMKLAKTKIIKKQKLINKLEPAGQEKAMKDRLLRHAGVLGLSAMITSNPYTVPDWLPAVLSFLSDHVNDPLPIGTSLKKLFVEFKHTHQDSWHEFREVFSEDELSRIGDVTGTHSYFA